MPFFIKQAIPCGVAVAAFDDHHLAEGAFILKSEAHGGVSRAMVERVAFPFISAIAQIKSGAHHQIHRFGCESGALHGGRIVDMPDFYTAGGGVDSEITGDADRCTGFALEDAEKHWVTPNASGGEPLLIFLQSFKRTVGQICPDAIFAVAAIGFKQIGSVCFYAQRFNDAVFAVHGDALWSRRRRPVGNDVTERHINSGHIVGVGFFGVTAIWHDCGILFGRLCHYNARYRP